MSATGEAPVAHLDFETRSAVNLLTQGAYRYAEDATTSVMNFYWRLPGVGEGLWRPGDPFPMDLLLHAASSGTVGAHNAVFERLIWNKVLRRTATSLPELRINQMDCTLARAAAVGLPQGLELLARELSLPVQKDMDGSAAMRRLAVPRARTPGGEYIFWERSDPEAAEDFAKLDAYVRTDVLTEEAAARMLPQLSERERRVWELDQKINDRGVPIDMESVYKLKAVVERVQARDGRRLWELTGGRITSTSQHVRTAEWIREQGLECDGVSADAADALRPVAKMAGLDNVVEVLDIREESGKASVKKLDAMMRTANADGRCRGQLQYHGAGPGRWAGRLVQFQNVVRVDPDRDGADVALLFSLLNACPDASPASIERLEDWLRCAFSAPVQIASKGLRGMVKAPPGRKLVGGDYSNIEGRIGAWFGNEDWKLRAFAEYDAGEGPDIYKLAVQNSFGIPHEQVDKTQRQLGKVQELALGFQGGVKAFLSMVAVYRNVLDLNQILEVVRNAADPALWATAQARYEKRWSFGLPIELWTALKVTVMAWRLAHPGIAQGWWDLQDAAIMAVSDMGNIYECADGRIKYLSAGGFLWCQLPSTRVIGYAKPRIVTRESRRPFPGFEHLDDEDLDDTNSELIRKQRQVEFTGRIPGTSKFGPKRLYGGLQWENAVQGTARDVMVEGMFAVEDLGYPLILTVHDELLSEVDAGFGSADEFRGAMLRPIDFIAGMPLNAAAWEDERYVK